MKQTVREKIPRQNGEEWEGKVGRPGREGKGMTMDGTGREKMVS